MTSEKPTGATATGANATGDAPLDIVVRGDARRRYPAERGVLSVPAEVSGPRRDEVYAEAVAVHDRLVAAVRAAEADGAVTTWSSQSVHVFVQRPVDQDGRPGAPVFHADIAVEAEFVDFDALSAFVDAWAVVDGVRIGGVNWDVTEANRLAYERDLRRLAVDDAVAKAQAYADAVGRGPVRAVQLADPGMSDAPTPRTARFAMAAAPGGGPELELRPRDIEIAAAVDARFVAH